MKKLHDRIRDSRKRLRLSQAQMAQLCSVSQPTIANWERGGHIPRREALEKLAACLKVDPVWLLSGKTSVNQSIIKTYLSKPIYHIPIYRFEDDAKNFTDSMPVKFMSLSIAEGDLFGLENTSEASKNRNTTYIFDRNMSTLASKAQLLVRQSTKLNIVEADSFDSSQTDPIARLLLTITSH